MCRHRSGPPEAPRTAHPASSLEFGIRGISELQRRGGEDAAELTRGDAGAGAMPAAHSASGCAWGSERRCLPEARPPRPIEAPCVASRSLPRGHAVAALCVDCSQASRETILRAVTPIMHVDASAIYRHSYADAPTPRNQALFCGLCRTPLHAPILPRASLHGKIRVSQCISGRSG